MRPAIRRTFLTVALVVLAAIAWAFAHAGTFLVREDPLRHADAILVLAGARFERAMEAYDVYHDGYAPVVVLSPGPEEPAEQVLRSRGVYLPREADPVREALVGLGIPRSAIVIGDGTVDNTAAEALLLRDLAARRGWHTVIVVTSKFHTRRTGFAMRRALQGRGITVLVRASKYDPVDPSHWWRHRRDVRWLLDEWPKLVAYSFGLKD
jgi:uncharacterized SAM-binding protein YcdF (DUF218 family)